MQALHVIPDKFGPKPPTPTRRRPLSARARPRGGRRMPTSLHRQLTANARFPAAARPQPVRAPPRATPRGRFRAPHEPLHGRSLSGLAPRASTRTLHVSPRHYLTAKGPLLAPLLEPKAATYDRYTSPSRGELRTCSTRNAVPENPSSPCTKRGRLCELEPEIAHDSSKYPRDHTRIFRSPKIPMSYYGLRPKSTCHLPNLEILVATLYFFVVHRCTYFFYLSFFYPPLIACH